MAYGGCLGAWLTCGLLDIAIPQALSYVLGIFTMVTGALSAMYTAWLFGQAKGRVLWMKRDLAAHLFVQAVLAASASLLLLGSFVDLGFANLARTELSYVFVAALSLQGFFILRESRSRATRT